MTARAGRTVYSETMAAGNLKTMADTGRYDHIAVDNAGKQILISTGSGVLYSPDGGKTFSHLPGENVGAADVKFNSDGKSAVIAHADDLEVLTTGTDGKLHSSSKTASLSQYSASQYPTSPLCAKARAGTDSSPGSCPFIETPKAPDSTMLNGGPMILSVQADPVNPGVYYAGTGNHVFRWNPGTGWQVLSTGVHNDSTVYNIAINPKNNEISMSTCNGVYHTTLDSVDAKTQAETPVANPKWLKYSSMNFLGQRQTDGGDFYGPYVPTPNYLRAFDIEVRPDHPNQLATAAASGVYLSNDDGKTWQRVPDSVLPTKEYTLAQWLDDGSLLVSSQSGDSVVRIQP